jgi:hypothetical protein
MVWLLLVVIASLLGGSIWLNVHTIRQNLALADQREALVDTIEESLDTLETVYNSIAHAAEIPVLSDEPIIREVLSDIKRAKNAVLTIAGQVVVYGQEKGAIAGE